MTVLELFHCLGRTFLNEDGAVSLHELVPLIFISDSAELFECLRVVLLADVVENYLVVLSNHTQIFDAFANLSVAAKDLNCCFLVHDRFVVDQEFDDVLHLGLSLLEKAVSLALRQLLVLVFEIWILSSFANLAVIIDLIQLQFQKPGRQTDQLWSIRREVLFLGQVLNNLLQVVMQATKQVPLHKLQHHLLERLLTGSVVPNRFLVLLVQEQLVSIYSRHEGPLLAVGVHQALFDITYFQVLFTKVTFLVEEIRDEELIHGTAGGVVPH